MAALIDSHCHLDYPEFEQDWSGTLARARGAGVGMMVTIGVKLSTFDRVLAVAERADHIYCTVGVHPHEAGLEGQDGPDKLIALATHDKVIGIGETGLDYYYDHSPRAAQRESFRAHIAAAQATGLPLVVHSRDAEDDTIDILEEAYAQAPFTGLIHCFSSSRQLAERALKIGLYISCSGIVTFNRAEDLRATMAAVPLTRLLVETDAPYLAPVPKRGKSNEPAFVAYTAARLAEVKGVTPEALATATTENFFTLFTKADRARMAQVESGA